MNAIEVRVRTVSNDAVRSMACATSPSFICDTLVCQCGSRPIYKMCLCLCMADLSGHAGKLRPIQSARLD